MEKYEYLSIRDVFFLLDFQVFSRKFSMRTFIPRAPNDVGKGMGGVTGGHLSNEEE